MDYNVATKKDVACWSETRWAGCFNPDEGVGLFLHAGRLRGNIDWWWAQTIIYLPGGRVAVERSWIRNEAEAGVKTASLDLRAETKGWSARFDGIVELTSTQALGRGPRGSAAPSVPARFQVVADASRPWWDMYSDALGKQDFAGDMHVEQWGHCTGTLEVAGEAYRLDGVTYYDHSAGVRDWTHFHSHHFSGLILPDATIHAIGVYSSPTDAREPVGIWFTESGEKLKLELSSMPRLEDVFGAPQQFDYVIKAEGMAARTYRVEVLHNCPCTITFDNDNINGVGWDLPGDPLFLVESQVRVTAPDGSIGYGHIERSNKKSLLTNPND